MLSDRDGASLVRDSGQKECAVAAIDASSHSKARDVLLVLIGEEQSHDHW